MPLSSDRSSATPRALFRQFTKTRTKKTTSPARTATTVQSAPNRAAPDSPRDVVTERITTDRHNKHKDSCVPKPSNHSPAMCSSRPTTVDASSHILHALKTPDLHTQSPCGNVSLADSSITTEAAFVPSIVSTQENSDSSMETSGRLLPAPSCPGTTTTDHSSSTYQPRSLRDLVRQDLRSTDRHTVQRALQQITLDCWDDAVARSLVARAGGILSICNILEDFHGQTSIELAACQALTKLSLDSENELAITELGGMEILWKLATEEGTSATTDNTDPRVIEAAWAALQNCSCQSSRSWDTDMQAWVQVIQKNTNPTVASHASAATANLCVANRARAHAFGQAGGVVAMAQALEQHWHDGTVRTDVAQSLARVCAILASPEE